MDTMGAVQKAAIEQLGVSDKSQVAVMAIRGDYLDLCEFGEVLSLEFDEDVVRRVIELLEPLVEKVNLPKGHMLVGLLDGDKTTYGVVKIRSDEA